MIKVVQEAIASPLNASDRQLSTIKGIEKSLGVELPSVVKKTLLGLEVIKEDVDFPLLFDGNYLGINGILNQYQDIKNPLSIFGAYECTTEFLTSEANQLYIDCTLSGDPEGDDVVRDLSFFLPIFEVEGSFSGIVIKPNPTLSGFINIDRQRICEIAPSISDDLADISDGLSSGKYHIDESYGEIVYPGLWFERKLVQLGHGKVSEEGEFIAFSDQNK